MTAMNKELQDTLKRQAAQEALEYLPEKKSIIGIGTGSTVNFFIEELIHVKEKIEGAVSTSKQTTELLKKHGIEVFSPTDVHSLPVYFDGADEINHSLQMIKGGGGALLREKIVASISETFVCIADESKYVSRLGHFPLPVEVLPLARSIVSRELIKLGAAPELRIGFTTDNGNTILDCHNFYIDEPIKTEKAINEITGVIDCGIFAQSKHMADILVLAKKTGVKVINLKH